MGGGDSVNGHELRTCLGDLYSVKWMEDSDLASSSSETLEQQYNKVKAEVNKSHVLQFGDQSIAQEPLVDFQGNAPAAAVASSTPLASASAPSSHDDSSLEARSLDLSVALANFLRTEEEGEASRLIALVQERLDAAKRFRAIARAVPGGADAPSRELRAELDLDCHFEAHQAYVRECGRWTEASLKHSATLAKLCEHTAGDAAPIAAAVRAVCAK